MEPSRGYACRSYNYGPAVPHGTGVPCGGLLLLLGPNTLLTVEPLGSGVIRNHHGRRGSLEL
ncbi:MAG: hypothetical protein MZV63_07320 [Marinilabiliales bacterium]|nr:hypothetical protein [Marinilabiliales bacterium]